MKFTKAIFLCTLLTTRIKSEIFTSMAEIRQLIDTHKYVTDILQNDDVFAMEHNRNNLSKYTKLFKREQSKMEQERDFAGNPVNAFLLIKRLSVDLNPLGNFIWKRPDTKKIEEFPTEEDLQGATKGLWRLQLVYSLNVSQLAAGKFHGNFSCEAKPYFEETLPMLISDCMYIALYMYEKGKYANALPWMLEGLNKFYNKEPDEVYPKDNEADIVMCIVLTYKKMGDPVNEVDWTERLSRLQKHLQLEITPLRCEVQDFVPKNEFSQADRQKSSLYIDHGAADYLIDIHRCSRKVPFPEEKRKHLYCHYKRGSSPFLHLAPFKAEQIHQDPDILMFYNVISDADIEVIQNTILTRRTLRSSTITKKSDGSIFPSPNRVSKSAQLRDDEYALTPVTQQIAAKLLTRIEQFSDLNGDYAEVLQVVHYGLGGHYSVHHDFHTHADITYGNRIATALFYLSDVEQGGATVFTAADVTVFPIKGAALLWDNLLPSGQGDYRSVHLSCPVLRGYKWVITSWLHEFGQEFIRPCKAPYPLRRSVKKKKTLWKKIEMEMLDLDFH